MSKQKITTHTLTEIQLTIRKINRRAAVIFTHNCDRLRQTLQRREKYPLPLDRSLELEQLDKLMSYIAQQPKTLYWTKRSLKTAQKELQNKSKYLNWNKEEWKKWTKILNFLQTNLNEIDRKSRNLKNRVYYHNTKQRNGNICYRSILVSRPTEKERKSPEDTEKVTNIGNAGYVRKTNC
jgi:hypothetical protein